VIDQPRTLRVERRFRAVIFDMDGVLTDSEPAFFAAFNDILARYGKHIEMPEYEGLIGTATSESWSRVLAMKQLDAPLDEIIEAYEAPLMVRLREPRPPLPHALPLIRELRACDVPVGLCTASYRRWADAILGGAGLEGLFDALSTAEMVERTKPDPAAYVLAAELLGVPAQDCIAVEDSRSGLQSAMGAGMYVIQLRATSTAAPPMAGVDAMIGSLAEFPIELVAPPRGD
jgi:HAD superfamily hydrolase (TIGR01509 family)